MKAVFVLLCLALTRFTAASIFRQQAYYPQMDTVYVQNLDYIDQYQQQAQQQQQIQQQQQQMTRQQKTKNHHHRHHPDTSSSSQETRERVYDEINNEYAIPLDIKNYESPLYSVIDKKQQRPNYGDVISWRGIQIAAGPKSAVNDQKDIEKIFGDAYNTMKHVGEESKSKFHQAFEVSAATENEDVHLNATQLLKKHNYRVEEHTVKTDDGYYLTLFRIPPRKVNQDNKSRVVLLMPGVLGSADDWLLMGPGKSLAYLLADAGHDVWLGNRRGSKYSRRHVAKHPAQPDFWQFSNDEIAHHDLPAMIDYALNKTEQKKLYYVGYSEGTTHFFALAASRPEYQDKVAMVHALAPMVYMSNARSPLFRMIAPTSRFYEYLRSQLGNGEFKPSKELIHTAGGDMCEEEIGCKHVCSQVNFVMSGVNPDMDVETMRVVMGHLPAGGSTRQIKHYGQNVASHEFRKYDYGWEINQQVYGQPEPPKYDITNVNVPVALYYSENDWLAHPQDVERLQKELPNVSDQYKVPVENFTHMDFQFSTKAPEVVYQRLINSI